MEVTNSVFRFLINFRYLKCYNIKKYIYIYSNFFNINSESNLNSLEIFFPRLVSSFDVRIVI